MSSSDRFEPLDLDRGLPTTPEDTVALRLLRRNLPVLTAEEYFRFLATLPHPSAEDLRRRRGPQGEPFRL
jgi:hypothetical protein